jgi:CHASE1-domain containing sensor protein
MVPFVAGGLIVWAVLGLILLANRSAMVEQGRGGWLSICLAGFLVGLPGLALMIVHDRNRRRRRATRPPTDG